MKQYIENVNISYENFTEYLRIDASVITYIKEPSKHFTSFPYGVTEEEITMYCLETGTNIVDLKSVINQLRQVRTNSPIQEIRGIK